MQPVNSFVCVYMSRMLILLSRLSNYKHTDVKRLNSQCISGKLDTLRCMDQRKRQRNKLEVKLDSINML